LDRIFQDLESVKNDIMSEIKDSSDSIDFDLALFTDGRARRAMTLLKTADGGCGFKSLKPAAMALEYLQLGALKHFGPGRESVEYGAPQANLSLITADYYYAKALRLIVALGDDRLVELLCDALSEVSEGYAWPEASDAGFRQEGFTRAAHRLGCLMADKTEYDNNSLTAFIEEVDSALFTYSS
jgi:hypothetical protein